MKRRNGQMAVVGEGTTPSDMAPENLVQGDEAVDIDVTSGKIMVVVPAGTPDDQIFDEASLFGGELELENGLRVSFEIRDEAMGAQFTASKEKQRDDDHEGLSSLPDVPGGA